MRRFLAVAVFGAFLLGFVAGCSKDEGPAPGSETKARSRLQPPDGVKVKKDK